MLQSIRKSYFLIFITTTALLSLLPVCVFAVDTATITLKDGTVYEDVSYFVNNRHKTIEISMDPGSRTVSFIDVERIVNGKGENVTKLVLGGHYKPENSETGKSEADEVYARARRKLWNIGISFGGNYCFPMGDYYDGLASGPGFDGDIFVALTHNLALRASVSYASISPDDNLAFIATDDYADSYLLDNYSFSSWRYFLSAQYYYRPDRTTPGKVIYFLYSGLGAVTDKTSADQTYLADDPADEYTIRIKDSETNFGTVFGAGLNYMFEPKIGLYVGAKLNLVWRSHSDQGEEDYVSYTEYAYQFDLKAGITVLLK